jgi:hypothetical protein
MKWQKEGLGKWLGEGLGVCVRERRYTVHIAQKERRRRDQKDKTLIKNEHNSIILAFCNTGIWNIALKHEF